MLLSFVPVLSPVDLQLFSGRGRLWCYILSGLCLFVCLLLYEEAVVSLIGETHAVVSMNV